MIAATSVVELVGSRVLRPQPPRGTSSRILSVRLYRCFHHRHALPSRRSPTAVTNVLNLSRSTANARPLVNNFDSRGYATTEEHPAAGLGYNEYHLVQDLLNRFPDGPPKAGNSPETTQASENSRAKNVGVESSSETVQQLLPIHFQKALQAMRQNDTRRLLIYLRRIVMLPDRQLHDAIDSLPRTTFTEFLRSLDPFCVARDADPTDGTNITAGMFTMLNLESTIDEWGIRRLYVRLLQRMLVLMKAFKATRRRLNSQEYTYLIRCAGAAADIKTAKWIWHDMVQTGDRDWRQSDLYYDYIRARFLTEPLYTSYDKTRVMVLPRNLHRAKTAFKCRHRPLGYLDRLRFKLRSRRFRFGLNPSADYAEDFTRVLRKTKPPRKVLSHILINNYAPTERLLCAIMVAHARAGSLRFVASRILQDYFGIKIGQLNLDELRITETQSRIIRPGVRLRPTVRLMEAVVETYGCNAEIALATQIVEHISTTFKIPIPLQVWLSLLEWTFVIGTQSLRSTWKKAGMLTKLLPIDTVEMIWDAMVNNGVEPGPAHHAVLIRHFLTRHQFERAIPHIRVVRDHYEAQIRAVEEAALEYIQALRDGLGAAAVPALARYERARFRAGATWYDLQKWLRQLFLRWRPIVGDHPDKGGAANSYSRFAHRVVPDLIAEFRDADVVPNPALYRTPSGYVNLADPCREYARTVFVGSMANNVPMPRGRAAVLARGGKLGPYPLRSISQRKVAVLSSRSLAPQVGSRLDPWVLLGGHRNSFRTVRLPPRFGRRGAVGGVGGVESMEEQQQQQMMDDYDDDY